jgi:hypothetical protein
MRVMIGYDPREQAAYDVAESSLRKRASGHVDVTPLRADRLAAMGLLRRTTDTRGGSIYDLTSNASASTEFAISRFLVPHLAQTGFALFVDADVVFLDDVAKLFELADPSKAVQVVQHAYVPRGNWKMDGHENLPYSRKNWSSVCIWNTNHPANRRLSLHDVNTRTGRELHSFYWLHDDEIGALPARWNWLVGELPKPADPAIAHFTLGTPDMRGRQHSPHADIWFKERP